MKIRVIDGQVTTAKVLFMQFEGYRRSSHVPNLTPLIDIVFLLLVFFMLTSHFVREDSIDIELPEAETGEFKDNDKILQVVIKSNGVFFYADKEISPEELETVLTSDLLNKKDKIIQIKGDRSANLGKTVELIDLSRKAGAQGIDIITLKNSQK